MNDRQYAEPLIVRSEGVERLVRVPPTDRARNERWLQGLLFEHPQLLPIAEIEPAFAGAIPIVRELPTSSGRVDLLLANSDGYLTIVETKLWRNPQARREVVAQVVDYVKAMATWGYDDLRHAVAGCLSDRHEADPLLARVAPGDEAFDTVRFINRVARNLRHGRHLVLIVGDAIQDNVHQMAEFLQGTPLLGFTLGLVEMATYRVGEDVAGPLLVQPRIVAKTAVVTRVVVEVEGTVKAGEVSAAVSQAVAASAPTAGTITVQTFYEDLAKHAGPTVAEFARSVVDGASGHELDVEWGAAGPSFRFAPEGLKGTFNFASFDRRGTFVSSRLVDACYGNGVPTEIGRNYLDGLVRLIPGTSRDKFGNPSLNLPRERLGLGGKPDVPLAKLAVVKDEWLRLIDEAVQQIRTALGTS